MMKLFKKPDIKGTSPAAAAAAPLYGPPPHTHAPLCCHLQRRSKHHKRRSGKASEVRMRSAHSVSVHRQCGVSNQQGQAPLHQQDQWQQQVKLLLGGQGIPCGSARDTYQGLQVIRAAAAGSPLLYP
jgi:hypothetical protein